MGKISEETLSELRSDIGSVVESAYDLYNCDNFDHEYVANDTRRPLDMIDINQDVLDELPDVGELEETIQALREKAESVVRACEELEGNLSTLKDTIETAKYEKDTPDELEVGDKVTGSNGEDWTVLGVRKTLNDDQWVWVLPSALVGNDGVVASSIRPLSVKNTDCTKQ